MGAACEVSFRNKHVKDCAGSEVSLDADLQSGYGAETITIKPGPNASALEYWVEKYSNDGPTLAETEATVAHYRGDQLITNRRADQRGWLDFGCNNF